MKKVILFLASKKGFGALKTLINSDFRNSIGYVFTFKETNVVKDWSTNIKELCEMNNILCSFWDSKSKNELKQIVIDNKITSAIAISWKYLLPLEINDHLEDNLIVFHDSLLPKYRGFSPTPTAIICGEKEIGVTALFAVDEVDKGPIIEQRKQYIAEDSYIKDIIDEQTRIYADLLISIISKIMNNTLHSYDQDERQATYSIWRNVEDCHINWNESAINIYNMIRAVGDPYMGAYTFIDEEKVIVEKATIMNYDLNFAIRTPGKIWSIENGKPIIICGKGLIKIDKAHKENSEEYLFTKIRKCLK